MLSRRPATLHVARYDVLPVLRSIIPSICLSISLFFLWYLKSFLEVSAPSLNILCSTAPAHCECVELIPLPPTSTKSVLFTQKRYSYTLKGALLVSAFLTGHSVAHYVHSLAPLTQRSTFLHLFHNALLCYTRFARSLHSQASSLLLSPSWDSWNLWLCSRWKRD